MQRRIYCVINVGEEGVVIGWKASHRKYLEGVEYTNGRFEIKKSGVYQVGIYIAFLLLVIFLIFMFFWFCAVIKLVICQMSNLTHVKHSLFSPVCLKTAGHHRGR